MTEGRSGTGIAPVRKTVEVAIPVEEAFRVFTEEMGEWWPVETHSVAREGGVRVVVEPREGGRVYEESRAGATAVWGTVVAWDPPARFAMTWHPGRTPDTAQRVDVRFEGADGGTRVELVHTGWEALGPRASEVRGKYEEGWTPVLGGYRSRAVAGAA